MIKSLWINLPVKSVERSKEFFTHLGFTLNLNYGSRADSACFLVGEQNIVIMLFEEPLFKGFTSADIIDTKLGTEVLLSIDAESVEEVNEIIQKAVNAGGVIYAEPGFKDGWMYGAGFVDLDGHRWNILYMDISKLPKG